jgi:hypothetical protein
MGQLPKFKTEHEDLKSLILQLQKCNIAQKKSNQNCHLAKSSQ